MSWIVSTFKGERGQTLLETLVTAMVSSAIIAAAASYFQPAARAFSAMNVDENMRIEVAGAADTMERDAANMVAIYVDPAQCYTVCMADGKGNRLYYYWDQSAPGPVKKLYRKQEPVTSLISCTGGKVFATGLDSTKTSFSMAKDLLNVSFASTNPNTKSSYSVATSIFPSIQERQIILTEGFECATLKQGWVVTTGARSSWTINGAGAHQGHYQISDSEASGGASTTTIQIAVDLSRVANAHISFEYMNDGHISNAAPSDAFSLSLYDGISWHTVFTDNSGTLISSPRYKEVDISSYALNQKNQIMFSGGLKNADSHWYVDSISVFNP